MKSASNLIERLKILPHFRKDSIHQLGVELGLSDKSVDTYISRFLKRKQLYQLKRGMYVSADFFEKNKHDTSYTFYLSNVIRPPSYISSWAALQYYNLTTEAIRTITSVTPKVTRTYQTKVGTFAYQSINGNLFTGFSLAKGTFDFFIASPSKALFDLIYFRTHQFRGLSENDVMTLVEELRIDIEEMEKPERENFHAIISTYFHE